MSNTVLQLVCLSYSKVDIMVETYFHIILLVDSEWDEYVVSDWFGVGIDHYTNWWTGHPGEMLMLTDLKCTGAVIFQ